jgi:hypothetical protein
MFKDGEKIKENQANSALTKNMNKVKVIIKTSLITIPEAQNYY